MRPAKMTPMMQQYLSLKDEYDDALLFYRMGDFFELFFDDAELASRELDITLTSRNKKDDTPIPMCGVPHRSARGYIARLIEKGYKVAVCDQVEDPAASKGLVKREVVRVVTPGMIVDDDLLDGKSNNFILAIARDGSQFGLSYLDISTGTFRITQTDDDLSLVDDIHRVSAREVLLPAGLRSDEGARRIAAATEGMAVTELAPEIFAYARSRERLLDQFGTLSLEGFGCDDIPAGVMAAGALVHYVRETQKQHVGHITGIQRYSLSEFMQIDDLSCQNLELMRNLRSGTRQATLLGVMDHTITSMGGRLLKQWMRYPLVDPGRIARRHDAVLAAVEAPRATRTIRDLLKTVHDLERLNGKVIMGHANARDMLALKQSFFQLPLIREALNDVRADALRWTISLEDIMAAAALIDRAVREEAPVTLSEGGIIQRGYNETLDELIEISTEGKGFLVKLEAREKSATGIATLKVRYNKVFGYYIEVPKTQSDRVPAHYVRKQTLVNAERYITDELKQFEDKVMNAEERRITLEQELFQEVVSAVRQHHRLIQETAGFVARLDCLLGLADAADRHHYSRPEINSEGIIDIVDGRHPVIEKMVTAERFVPNTIRLDNQENQILVITGPNMAGKSTVLRQVALTVLMAQMGGFVPARKARIHLTDRIFTRVGALDNLSQGQSTFMVEMQETANILNSATADSLVIMDEIGRGTSTFDGLSIAWAVAEHLHDLHGAGVKTLFATHYHELTELAGQKPRVRNFNIAVKEWNDNIIFLRKLVEGGTNRSYGIQVARLAGIPRAVIDRAKAILFEIENGRHVAVPPSLRNDASARDRQIQLDLFGRPVYHAVIDKLRKLDTSTMTPLEALNLLERLKEQMEDPSD